MHRLISRSPLLFVLSVLLVGTSMPIHNGKAAAVLTPPSSHVSCSTFLQDYQDWATQTIRGENAYVKFTLASNQYNGIVSSTEGILDYAAPNASTPAALVGVGSQYFNDRQYRLPSSDGIFTRGPYPFNPDETDQLGVQVVAQTATVVLTMLSWGGGLIIIENPTCAQGVLYGFGIAPHNSLFVLNLEKRVNPAVK